MRPPALLLILALTGLAAAPAMAGEGGPARDPAVFALVVGVNRSVDAELEPLRYADDDAARYFELFTTVGAKTYLVSRLDDNTARLHNQARAQARLPTSASFDQAVRSLARDVKKARRRGLQTALYFVYAGHGNVDGARGYITLEDDRLSGPDLRRRVLDKVPAHEKHLVVDACYSFFLAYGRGAGGRRRPLDGFGGLSALADDEKLGLLLSTSSAAESHEWEGFQAGVFSHEVRSALWGAADVDGDGQVAYAEVAAFVQKANASIPNERYRPRVHARPPRGEGTLLRLGGARERGIEVAGTLPGHWLVEDKLGVRVADLHNQDGQTVTLLRPPRGVLFFRRSPGDEEYRVPPADGPTRLSQLKPSRPEVSGRGAAHHSFAKVFALPFGQADVAGYSFPEPDTTLPEPPLEIRRAALGQVLKKGSSLAVLDLQPTGADEVTARLATAALAEGLAEEHRGPVLSTLDLEALLQKRAFDEVTGCGDERCLGDLSAALDVDEVVAGQVGRRDDQVLVFLSRIDPRRSVVLGRASRSFPAREDLRLEVKAAGRALLDPAAAAAGDEPVAEMRTALVVDEVSDGARVPRGAVSACIKEQLLAAGAPLVSARQVRAIRGRSAVDLRELDPIDVITEDEADALLLATVDYAEVAAFEGVKSYEAVLSLEMVQIDTGAVILADSKRARRPGHSSRQAVSALGKTLCEQVRPSLQSALARRQAKGSRVVLEVRGRLGGEAEALARALARYPSIARAKVRRTTAKRTVLDLVVKGRDGVGLALALDEGAWRSLGLGLEEASASRVVVTAR